MPCPAGDVIVAESPARSQPTCAEAMTTCESTDQEWVLSKYCNFRLFVRSLAPQEPKLLEWSLWLDKLPLSVFLAGGDGELAGVRGASDSTNHNKRADEAVLVLERWAMDYKFELSRISETDRIKLARYIELFAVA